MRHVFYVVSGSKHAAYDGAGWFSEPSRGYQWRTCSSTIHCKTLAHAIAQYRRLEVKYRQIDRIGQGEKRALKWGSMR